MVHSLISPMHNCLCITYFNIGLLVGGNHGRGIPLGNLTSQFFANVFLNELDHFVKQKLNAKYYIRYVDDFVILHESPEVLREYMKEIDSFLRDNLDLELHPDKSKIIPMSKVLTS